MTMEKKVKKLVLPKKIATAALKQKKKVVKV